MATKTSPKKRPAKKENLPAAKAEGNTGASPSRANGGAKKPVKPIKS